MPTEPPIHRLPAVAAGDTAVVHHITELINRVYLDAEAELWHEDIARTDPDEVAGSIAAGQIIVARSGDDGDRGHDGDSDSNADDDGDSDDSNSDDSNSNGNADSIIGVVQAHATEGRGWFGMLAVDPRYRSAGIGRRLVHAAEDLARDGGATDIEISVIMTTDASYAPKVELAQWYQRLGYQSAETVSVAQGIPGLEELLAVPCHLQILRKQLSTT